jgi:hypothetical protein
VATINKNFKVKNGLDVSGNTTVEGTITATTFIGDGSGLSGVVSTDFSNVTTIPSNIVDQLKGPKGDTGDTGADGVPGLNGMDGDDGQDGAPGLNGLDGLNGMDGNNGLSAHEIALLNGFTGTEQQWLDSLVGIQGIPGNDGMDGRDGNDGLSAYQIAVDNGFIGTEQDWIDGLVTATSTQTLTNKTISGTSNTLSNIPNSALTNSSITINDTPISLGTILTGFTAPNPSPLTIGFGLIGIVSATDQIVTSYTGNEQSNVIIQIDTDSLATVATSGSYNDLSNQPSIQPLNANLTTLSTNGFGVSANQVPQYDANAWLTIGANWKVKEVSGVLFFAHNGVNRMKIDSSGNLTVTGDVTAFGTV